MFRRLVDVPAVERHDRWWLYGTARRVLANQYRSSRHRAAFPDVQHQDFPVTVGDHGERGFTAEDIAQVVGISASAATKRLQRANE